MCYIQVNSTRTILNRNRLQYTSAICNYCESLVIHIKWKKKIIRYQKKYLLLIWKIFEIQVYRFAYCNHWMSESKNYLSRCKMKVHIWCLTYFPFSWSERCSQDCGSINRQYIFNAKSHQIAGRHSILA